MDLRTAVRTPEKTRKGCPTGSADEGPANLVVNYVQVTVDGETDGDDADVMIVHNRQVGWIGEPSDDQELTMSDTDGVFDSAVESLKDLLEDIREELDILD